MRPMRNVRVFGLIQSRLGWLVLPSEDLLHLPGGHMREGESLRYALTRMMRDTTGITGVRLGDVVAIAEREGRLPLDRCIEIYLRATIFGEFPDDNRTHWISDEEFDAQFPELSVVARSTSCAPYLGIVRRPFAVHDEA